MPIRKADERRDGQRLGAGAIDVRRNFRSTECARTAHDADQVEHEAAEHRNAAVQVLEEREQQRPKRVIGSRSDRRVRVLRARRRAARRARKSRAAYQRARQRPACGGPRCATAPARRRDPAVRSRAGPSCGIASLPIARRRRVTPLFARSRASASAVHWPESRTTLPC